jgi:hypothetical protein
MQKLTRNFVWAALIGIVLIFLIIAGYGLTHRQQVERYDGLQIIDRQPTAEVHLPRMTLTQIQRRGSTITFIATSQKDAEIDWVRWYVMDRATQYVSLIDLAKFRVDGQSARIIPRGRHRVSVFMGQQATSTTRIVYTRYNRTKHAYINQIIH